MDFLGVKATTTNRIATYSELGGGLADGDKGDITVSGSGTVWTVDPNSITTSKLAQAAAKTIRGNSLGSTANVADMTVETTLNLLTMYAKTIAIKQMNFIF